MAVIWLLPECQNNSLNFHLSCLATEVPAAEVCALRPTFKTNLIQTESGESTQHQVKTMTDHQKDSGVGFGWSVLFFGAIWLIVSAWALIKLKLANDMVLCIFAVVTLIWAFVSVGLILTKWSPRRR